MLKVFKDFWLEEDGLGTVEIVIILAVLVGIAIIFRKAIIKFATDLMGQFFTEGQDAKKGVEDDPAAQKFLSGNGITTPKPTN